MLDRLARIEIEDGLADGAPAVAIVEEDRRGVAQIADRCHTFHVATLDRLKRDRHGDQRGQAPTLALAGKGDFILPFATLPAQTARLAACRRGRQKRGFEMLALL